MENGGSAASLRESMEAEHTLENNQGQEVDVGHASELLGQILQTRFWLGCLSNFNSENHVRTLGTNDSSVYLLVRTLFRSYPRGSVLAPSTFTQTVRRSFGFWVRPKSPQPLFF